MNSKEISSRSLEGPNSYHLYIGFSSANRRIVCDLRKRLEERGVSCCLRSTNDGIKESIIQDVAVSQKCLLFLTSDYLKDGLYQIETQIVLDKAKSFCRDVVIILKSEDLEVIPESLQEFITEFKPEKLNDEKLLKQFVDLVTREPNMKLADMPKPNLGNLGYSSACSYFYGFLRLVLPDFKKRLIESTLKNDPDLVPKTVQKMLIIMPESCVCAVELQVLNKIEFTDKFVNRVAHRAGNKNRDYKSSLYKLISHEKEEYYFVGELATPLLTIYEMYFYHLFGMTKDQVYAERDAFYFTLKAILSHPDNAECNDQFKLLYWSDPGTDKPNKLEIYDFLLPVLRQEISLQRRNEMNQSKNRANHDINVFPQNHSLVKNFFEPVTIDGSNPARIYDDNDNYPMDRRPRGMCLIVNIANFDKGHRHLQTRRGAERDAELLKKLFEDLYFNVQVHKDVNAQTLESLFVTMHITDHTNYDAFVCCILTHGKLGVIYTSDGKPVEILKLVDFFSDKYCPSLKGKPKMFFIQACQKGDPEPESGATGNSLPHGSSTGDHLTRSFSQNMASDLAVNVANRETVGEEIRENTSSVEVGICNIVVTEVDPTIEEDATSVPTVSVLDESSAIEEDATSATIVSVLDESSAIEEDATSVPTVSVLDESLLTTLKHKAVLVPGSPDFLMSYSTLPGSISYRDTQTGSLYIQSLNDCLRKGIEIDRALKMVSSGVRKALRQRGELDGGPERFQLPFHLTSGMDRLIYL